MRRVALTACVVALLVASGCVSQAKYKALLAQNEIQAAKIKGLQRDLDQTTVEASALRTQVGALQEARDAASRLLVAKDAQIGVLKARCDDLEARARDLAARIAGRTPERIEILPREVSNALQDLARSEPSLEFDPQTGTCKFSSDILFESGDDTVRAAAEEVLRKFAAIFTGVGKDLNLRIEGHTDDRPIAKATTKAKHPTNWHLSAHRAISVLRVLFQAGVAEERMCAAGFGKWRPIADNGSPAGQAKNRRVEIYVVTGPLNAGDTVATEPTVMGGE